MNESYSLPNPFSKERESFQQDRNWDLRVGNIEKIEFAEGIKDQREMRKMLEDPTFLPTRDFVVKAFTRQSGEDKGYKDSSAFWNFMRGRKNKNGERIELHELLTQEFIEALSEHYSELIVKHMIDHPDEPFVLLEVGAGDGRLTGFIRAELMLRFGDKVVVVATDKKSNGVSEEFPVENMDYKDALDKYKPNAVIVSWMPCKDWTKDFRDPKRNIQEYIHIGEPEAGMSGTMETWDDDIIEADNFSRELLVDATEAQISRADMEFNRSEPNSYHSSFTYAFIRNDS